MSIAEAPSISEGSIVEELDDEALALLAKEVHFATDAEHLADRILLGNLLYAGGAEQAAVEVAWAHKTTVRAVQFKVERSLKCRYRDYELARVEGTAMDWALGKIKIV